MNVGVNVDTFEFFKGMPLLEAGKYPVILESCVAERATDPASGLLKITFVIAQGHAAAGRKLFYRLNIWNKSADAKEMAHKQLKNLVYALGMNGQTWNQDTDSLVNRQCMVEINNDGTYNNVKQVMDMAGNIPGGAPLTAGAPAANPFGNSAPAGGSPFGAQAAPGSPTGSFVPPGAVPAGFQPGAAQPGAAPNPFSPGAPPQQQAPPQGDPRAGWQRSPDGQWMLNPQTGGWEQATQPQAPPPAAGPFGGAPPQFGGQQSYQPQAAQPGNPAQGFNPGQPQQQPPAGWPQ